MVHLGKVKVFSFKNMTQWIQVSSDLEGNSSQITLAQVQPCLRRMVLILQQEEELQASPGNLGYMKVFGHDLSTDSFIQVRETLWGSDNRTEKVWRFPVMVLLA